MKKHLEVLDLLAAGKITNQDPRVEEALREAVSFCRGVLPLDEAAETRICEAICLPLAAAQWLESVDAVRAGRAQARAEGYASGHAIAGESILECGRLRAQLSASQAQWENEHRLWNEADTKLSAAQAEIANQQSQVAELQCLGVELETKLTNLRDELEHAAVELETSGTSMRDSRLAARIRSVLAASR